MNNDPATTTFLERLSEEYAQAFRERSEALEALHKIASLSLTEEGDDLGLTLDEIYEVAVRCLTAVE